MLRTLFSSLSIPFIISLLLLRVSGAACFASKFPKWLQQSSTSNLGDVAWNATLGNAAGTRLFLGGSTSSFNMIPNAPTSQSQLAIAACIDLTSNNYIWAKSLVDTAQYKANYIAGIALNSAETLLAMAGQQKFQDNQYFFFLDPNSGNKLYPTITISTHDENCLMSSASIIFAGSTRLYVTGKNYKQLGDIGTGGQNSRETAKYFILDYTTSTVLFGKQLDPQGNKKKFCSASLIDLNPASANNAEIVIMGGAYSTDDKKWRLALQKIEVTSDTNQQIKSLDIQWDNNGDYKKDEDFPFISRMVYDATSQTIYAVTQTASFYQMGTQSLLCKFPIITGNTGIDKSNYQIYKLTGLSGQQNTLQMLDLKFDGTKIHVIASIIGNAQAIYFTFNFNTEELKVYSLYNSNVYMYSGCFTGSSTNTEVIGAITAYQGYFAGMVDSYVTPAYSAAVTFSKKAASVTAVRKVTETCNTEQSPQITTWQANNTNPQNSAINFGGAEQTDNLLSSGGGGSQWSTTTEYTFDVDFSKVYSQSGFCQTSQSITATSGSISDQTLLCTQTTAVKVSFSAYNSITSQTCADENWVYSMTLNSVPTVSGAYQQLITYSPTDKKLSLVSTSSSLTTQTYAVQITGTLPSGYSQSFGFNLKVKCFFICSNSTDSITLSTTSITTPITFYVGSSSGGSTTVSQFNLAGSSYCQQSDITYTQAITPSTGATGASSIAVSSGNKQFTYSSLTYQQVGTYDITVTGKVTNDAGTFQNSVSFQVIVRDYCLEATSVTVTGPTMSDQIFYVGVTSSSSATATFAQFTASNSACTSAYFSYSYTITPTPVSASRIVYTSSNRQLTWGTATSAYVNVYIITLTGTCASSGSPSASSSFKLTISLQQCQTSSDTITLTASTAPAAQVFQIGTSSASSLTQTSFAITASYCVQADISYSYQITGGTSSGRAKITTSSLTVNWSGFNAAEVGVYTINLTGNVNTSSSLSPFFKSVVFTLTVVNCASSTDLIALTASTAPAAQSYAVGSVSPGSATFSSFTVSAVYCVQSDIVYTIVATPQSGTSNGATKITTQFLTASWSGFTAADVGIYTITITGRLTTSSTSSPFLSQTQFSLTVTCSCAQTLEAITISSPSPEPNHIFTVGDVNGFSTTILNFTQTSSVCNSSDIVYTSTVTALNGATGASLLKTTDSRTFNWRNMGNSNNGTYNVTVRGTIQAASKFTYEMSFLVKITAGSVALNTAPYFTNYTQTTYDFSLMTSNQMMFGQVQDDQSDVITSNFTVIPSSSCFKFDLNSASITFDVPCVKSVASTSFDVEFKLTVNLTDSNQNKPLSTVYPIIFTVPQIALSSLKKANTINNNSTDSNKTTNKTADVANIFPGYIIPNQSETTVKKTPPYLKTIKISNQGLMQVTFSENLIIPSNITMIDDAVVKLEIVPSEIANLENLDYSWKVIKFTNTFLSIQLTFAQPLYVSYNGNTRDQIKLTMLNNVFFMSSTSYQRAIRDEVLIAQIPPQLSNNAAANAALGTVTESAGTAGNTIVIGNFVANLFMSGSLSLLWGLINSLQIIANLPLLNVNFPANAQSFYTFIINIANFDIIPTDMITSYFVSQTTNSTNNFESIITSSNFQSHGIESDNIVANQGPIFLAVLLGLLLLATLVVLYIFRKHQFVQFIYDKIYHMLFWNSSLRFVLEGYLNLMMSAVIQILGGLSWVGISNILNSVYTISIVVICNITPVSISIYLKQNFAKFTDAKFVKKFSLTKELSKRGIYTVAYPSIFCYRRLLFILLILLVQQWVYFQIQGVIMLNAFTIIVIGISEPFQEKRAWFMEFYNEATIMLCSYHLFLFTKFVPNPEARYTMGYSLIGVTSLNLAGNVIVLLGTTLMQIYTRLRKMYLGYSLACHKKAQKVKRLENAKALDTQDHAERREKQIQEYFKKVQENKSQEQSENEEDSNKKLEEKKRAMRNRRLERRGISRDQQNQIGVTKTPNLFNEAIVEVESFQENYSDHFMPPKPVPIYVQPEFIDVSLQKNLPYNYSPSEIPKLNKILEDFDLEIDRMQKLVDQTFGIDDKESLRQTSYNPLDLNSQVFAKTKQNKSGSSMLNLTSDLNMISTKYGPLVDVQSKQIPLKQSHSGTKNQGRFKLKNVQEKRNVVQLRDD